MDVNFPLFAFEKDDCSMFLLEDASRILYHLEAIDIRNGEYIFWDADGKGVTLSVADDKISQISGCVPPMSISDAFRNFAQSLGIHVSLEGNPTDVWKRIVAQFPKKEGFWKGLFSTKKQNLH